MGFIKNIYDLIEQHNIATTAIILLAYPASQIIFNLYFHPLSKFPGPKLWAASRLPFIYCLLTGQLVKKEREFHEKYGEFFRLAPDEVSFTGEQAWNDIYTYRPGHKRARRDKAFYIAPNNQADNLITTSDIKFHARVRGLLSNSFTEDALCNQESLIESYADSLIAHLREIASKPQGGRADMTSWLNFFTMDVISDLAFGESFNCLKNGEFHTWVKTLFSYLKGMSIAAAPRYYPTTEFIFQKLIPKSVLDGQRQHTEYANRMINRRLDAKGDRPDFMTPFMKKNVNFENMSREEILSTFSFIIVGGSETTATTLTGIFNHLLKKKNEPILKRLVTEIRSRFADEKDIVIQATKDLDYLEAVLREGLRMCNPIPGGLPRVVPEGGDEYCGIYLPEGTRLAVRTYATNRSAKLFANPDQFVPERWLPKGERPTAYDNDVLAASKPFSVGFHSCLGQPLAWVELRLVVIRLLWAFDFSVDEVDEVTYDEFPVIMLVQKMPMYMRLANRQMQSMARKG